MNSPQQEEQKGVFSVFKQDANTRQTPFYCRWTEEEDRLLYEAVELHGPHKWSLIARHIPDRTPVQCSTRWLGALNPHVHKGRWSPEEDQALTLAVQSYLAIDDQYTEENLPWSRIAQNIPNRTGIQCQARWTEALDPSVRKGRWKKEEDDMLKIGVERFGCCWIRVASSIPGRTQRQCRTRWNQIQSKQEKLRLKQLTTEKKKRETTTVNKKRRKTNVKKQETAAIIVKEDVEPSYFYQEAIVIPSDVIQSPITASSVSTSVTEEEDLLFDDDYDFEIERREYFMQKQQQQQQQLEQNTIMNLFNNVGLLPFNQNPNLSSLMLANNTSSLDNNTNTNTTTYSSITLSV